MVTVPVCKCCGHPLPPDEIGKALTPLQYRIFNVIKRAGPAGIAARDIMDIVYADDPTGGPEYLNIIPVVVHQMRGRLAKLDLAIRCRRGPGATYKLEKLNAH